MSAPSRPFTALVMAGSRAAGDPLAGAAGVSHKALAPVVGMPMLGRVLAALRAAPRVDRIVVCGLDPQVGRDHPVLRGVLEPGTTELVAGGTTPAVSAAQAIDTLRLQPPLLITTADHPLLGAPTVEDFCTRSAALDVDLTFGLVAAELVGAAFPGVRRTSYRFRDGTYCGCNLYALLTAEGLSAPREWRAVEQHRKRPWRLVGVLGPGVLLRFLFGRLALAEVVSLVHARTGLRAAPIRLADAAAGFDVDTPLQLHTAEAFLRRRGC